MYHYGIIMNNIQIIKSGFALLATTVGLLACGGGDSGPTALRAPAEQPAAAQLSAADQRIDDSILTAQVRLTLARADAFRNVPIGVDTQNGIVTLSGQALTLLDRTHASTLAGTVKGVTSVNNRMAVKPG